MRHCACGRIALQNSEWCRACWDAWWRTVVERSRIQVAAAERKRRARGR